MFLRVCQLLALAAVAAQPSFSSFNISASEWVCNASLAVSFAADSNTLLACGDEALQGATAAMPRIALLLAPPVPAYVTLLVVDRDAPSAEAPSRSPLRHMAVSRVPGALLAAGVDAAALASAAGAEFFFNYSGPAPPEKTLCHRYYIQVYAEGGGPPALNVTASGRFAWDFPAWAASNNLTKLAVGMWRTQNADARTGGCDGAAPAASSSSLSLGLGIGLPLGLAVLACLWFVRAPLRRVAAACCGERCTAQRASASVKRAGGSFLDADLTGEW